MWVETKKPGLVVTLMRGWGNHARRNGLMANTGHSGRKKIQGGGEGGWSEHTYRLTGRGEWWGERGREGHTKQQGEALRDKGAGARSPDDEKKNGNGWKREAR